MATRSGKFLQIDFPDTILTFAEHERILPFAASQLYEAKVNNSRVLTQGADVKTVYEVTLDTEGISFDFKPGDAIGILPQNDMIEVDMIIRRLDLNKYADKFYSLSIPTNTTKKKPAIPTHIPQSSTFRMVLLKHLDIRSIPKKMFLKGLLEFTTDERDKEKLQKLSDPKQSDLYQQFICGDGKTLLTLLGYLPSCNPSIEFLFEHLPALLPRYYSISSSPLVKNDLVIVFSVVDFGTMKGVCTGWLENCIHAINPRLKFYFRKSSEFLMFSDKSVPVIMVGPGTGVAPFIGLLQDRSLRKGEASGELSLYFGCRYSDRDFIYKKELFDYLEGKTLNKLELAFSRETSEKVYVQNKLEEDGAEVVDAILNRCAIVCICGDAKNIGKSTEGTLISLIIKHGGKSEEETKEFLKDLRKSNRIQLDIWI